MRLKPLCWPSSNYKQKHEGNDVVRARGNHLIYEINNVDTILRKAQIVAIVNFMACWPGIPYCLAQTKTITKHWLLLFWCGLQSMEMICLWSTNNVCYCFGLGHTGRNSGKQTNVIDLSSLSIYPCKIKLSYSGCMLKLERSITLVCLPEFLPVWPRPKQ
jgi:hypothetical protein